MSVERSKELADVRAEPGSFRDRDGRVFYCERRVFRALSSKSYQDWERLKGSRFFAESAKRGDLIFTEEVPLQEVPLPDAIAGTKWAGMLEHRPIPFVSYPYEWSFGMLKQAALLQLRLLRSALEEDLIPKDASAYNVQWVGCRPVFIDISSFEPLNPGSPWVGYRQFCELFLFPLLLQAYRDIRFQPWLKGSIDGLSARDCWSMMSLRDLLRSGVLTHVFLQSRLQEKYGGEGKSVKTEMVKAGFGKKMIVHNVGRLQKLVRKLSWRSAFSTWSEYTRQHSYSERDERSKTDFVRQVCGRRHRSLVWDLGCNVGRFSRIAAADSDYVVAMDLDHLTVEHLFQDLRKEECTNILPLLMELSDPSPNRGWRDRERRSLTERGRPQLVLCLALLHHLVITANLPLPEVIEWLRSLGSELIIEFVGKKDAMVQRLLANKADQYADYELDTFELHLKRHFVVEKRQVLSSGTRMLYHCKAI